MSALLHAERSSKYVKRTKQGTTRSSADHVISHPDDVEPFIARASIVLPTGEVLLLDKANKNLKLLDSKFQVVAVMKFSTYPFDICASNNRKNEYYVTEPEEQSIHRIGAGQGRLALYKTKRLYEDCRGITCWKSGVAVTVMREGFIGTLGLLDYDCKIKKKMWETDTDMGLFRAPWYLESIRGGTQLVVSDQGKNSVFGIECKTLAVLFVFNHPNLVGPRTLAVDVNDNIYVIGSSETCHNVIKITPDGQLKGVLLTRKDKLNYPAALSYGAKNNCLVLQKDREKPNISVYYL
ncbi:hypothetical protein DPMN_123517 [Dreissena polymorpha]|uniref:Uncharacterized protein n=1 Tax=Dreissena polymorpha TaxID=45954 RepID=A0A9D4JRD3_DREPO|nr:hypothetical protein DPMN_123517 [Dreissena polymorpha]